jgi:hypothetical protein
VNELGVLVEGRLEAKSLGLVDLLDRVDMTAEEALGLFGPARLARMPQQATLTTLASVLDIPYREVVLAAAAACGVAITPAGGRDIALRQATHEQLLRELRRRMVVGQRGDARRRMTHLALVGQALAVDAG